MNAYQDGSGKFVSARAWLAWLAAEIEAQGIGDLTVAEIEALGNEDERLHERTAKGLPSQLAPP